MDWFKKKFEQAGRGALGVVQAANPFDAESKGNNLINQTQRTYGGTSEFKSILDRTNPVVSNKPMGSGAITAPAGQYADRAAHSNRNSRLWVSQDAPNQQQTLLHEGLHGAWDESPQNVRQSYLEAAQTALPPIDTDPKSLIFQATERRAPDPRSWLQQRSRNYPSAKGQTFQDLRTLDDSTQTEMHSFLPEYYEQYQKPIPPALQAYYSRFYTPGRNQERRNIADDLNRNFRLIR